MLPQKPDPAAKEKYEAAEAAMKEKDFPKAMELLQEALELSSSSTMEATKKVKAPKEAKPEKAAAAAAEEVTGSAIEDIGTPRAPPVTTLLISSGERTFAFLTAWHVCVCVCVCVCACREACAALSSR